MGILIVPNEKRAEAPISINGASSGNWLQPIYKFIAQECLHNKDIIEQIKKF